MTTPSHRWYYEGPGTLSFNIGPRCPTCRATLPEPVTAAHAIQVCEHCGNPTRPEEDPPGADGANHEGGSDMSFDDLESPYPAQAEMNEEDAQELWRIIAWIRNSPLDEYRLAGENPGDYIIRLLSKIPPGADGANHDTTNHPKRKQLNND